MANWKSVRKVVWTSIVAVFLLGGQVVAAETLSSMGSSVILKSFFEDAGKAFTAKTGVAVTTKAQMTGQGILGLLNDQCNIAGGGRPLKADEKARGLNERAFAKNIVAVFVNKNNPVDNLTSDQVKKISFLNRMLKQTAPLP